MPPHSSGATERLAKICDSEQLTLPHLIRPGRWPASPDESHGAGDSLGLASGGTRSGLHACEGRAETSSSHVRSR